MDASRILIIVLGRTHVTTPHASLPSVDELLASDTGRLAEARFGRAATVSASRAALAVVRRRISEGELPTGTRAEMVGRIARQSLAALEAQERPRLRRVFNLTGTVLHTNLGRAVLADVAIEAAAAAMRHPAALEYDLSTGERGERDDLVRGLVCELTGAEDAIVVNNNAAALLLVLGTLAPGRETIVSRGELIEIGGSFRLPAVLAGAGTRLREVGTTNRTHLRDYVEAIGPETGVLLKVHTSNYMIQGFTAEVTARDLAPLARAKGLPLVDDLGSGTLIDLSRYGLRRERTVQDALGDGADIVTFSGDKLLGGPQAGFIVGRKELVQRCAKHALKRALRLDKVRLAALEATLRLYRNPDRLAERLPTLRYLSRPEADIAAQAGRIAAALSPYLGPAFRISVEATSSQIGSGALPLETIASAAVAIAPADGRGRSVDALAQAFRSLPIPVIGRIEKGAIRLDLRCLDDEAAFVEQLAALRATTGDCQ